MVGWYHTGPRLRSSDIEVNEVIKRYVSRPVMTIVDVRSDAERGQGDIPTDAYFAVEEIKDVRASACVLMAISMLIVHIATGRKRYPKDVRSRTVTHRGRGSRRNRCRAPSPRHSKSQRWNTIDAGCKPTVLPSWPRTQTTGDLRLPQGGECWTAAAESTDRVQPSGRVQSFADP